MAFDRNRPGSRPGPQPALACECGSEDLKFCASGFAHKTLWSVIPQEGDENARMCLPIPGWWWPDHSISAAHCHWTTALSFTRPSWWKYSACSLSMKPCFPKWKPCWPWCFLNSHSDGNFNMSENTILNSQLFPEHYEQVTRSIFIWLNQCGSLGSCLPCGMADEDSNNRALNYQDIL